MHVLCSKVNTKYLFYVLLLFLIRSSRSSWRSNIFQTWSWNHMGQTIFKFIKRIIWVFLIGLFSLAKSFTKSTGSWPRPAWSRTWCSSTSIRRWWFYFWFLGKHQTKPTRTPGRCRGNPGQQQANLVVILEFRWWIRWRKRKSAHRSRNLSKSKTRK